MRATRARFPLTAGFEGRPSVCSTPSAVVVAAGPRGIAPQVVEGLDEIAAVGDAPLLADPSAANQLQREFQDFEIALVGYIQLPGSGACRSQKSSARRRAKKYSR